MNFYFDSKFMRDIICLVSSWQLRLQIICAKIPASCAAGLVLIWVATVCYCINTWSMLSLKEYVSAGEHRHAASLL